MRGSWAPFLMLLVAIAAGGCRDEEQGRKLSLDKGKYAGAPIPPPPAEAQKGWAERARKLSF